MPFSQPSHTLGYWRPWKKDSNFIDSWLDYNRDVSLQRYNAEIVSEALARVSREQVIAINNLSSQLTTGFEIISDKINVTNNKLDKLIQLELSSQLILTDIAYSLRIPDSEKLRLSHIKNAINFLNNVEKEPSFYRDAFSEFKKAENLNSNDFYTLYNIAMIYLYDTKNVDINSSKEYFLKAAKYSLLIEKNSEIYTKIISNANIKKVDALKESLTGYCYLQASICSYILGNDQEALELAIKANSLGLSYSQFYIAKYASRLGATESSIEMINSCLAENPETYKEIISDYDFILNEKVVDFLIKYSNEINYEYEKIKATLHPYLKKYVFEAIQLIEKAKVVLKYKNVSKKEVQDLQNAYKKLDSKIISLKKQSERSYELYKQKFDEWDKHHSIGRKILDKIIWEEDKIVFSESIRKWLTIILLTFIIGLISIILMSSRDLSIPNILAVAFLVSFILIEVSPFYKKNRNYKKEMKNAKQMSIEYENHYSDYETSKKELSVLQTEIKSLLPKIRFFRIEV